ncbi:hypothetical protein [Micromonospora marina]|uniref:hypothetical protein n=1 Tax=Micromonospora marina TaxID=307120 RepID=UPI003D7586D8
MTAPDPVQQPALNRLWVADISYLRTELILDTVGRPATTRPPARDQVIHHPDPGLRPVESAQYTSFEFGRTLRSCGVLASMGSVVD